VSNATQLGVLLLFAAGVVLGALFLVEGALTYKTAMKFKVVGFGLLTLALLLIISGHNFQW